MVSAVPDQPPIPALITAAHAGDRRAEGALITRFAAAVRTYARRRLKTADAVDEFAQEVFLRFVQALRAGQISEPERAGGFVLGICKNVARERDLQQKQRDADLQGKTDHDGAPRKGAAILGQQPGERDDRNDSQRRLQMNKHDRPRFVRRASVSLRVPEANMRRHAL